MSECNRKRPEKTVFARKMNYFPGKYSEKSLQNPLSRVIFVTGNQKSQSRTRSFLMAKTYVLDTNVLLHSAKALDSFQDNLVVLPMAVIEELDKFKKSQDELGRNSRQVVRKIDDLRRKGRLSEGVPLENAAGGKPSGMLRILSSDGTLPGNMDMSVADNRILQVAYQLQQEAADKNSVILITKDLNLRLRADGLGIPVEDFECENVKYEELYTGMTETEVPQTVIDSFFKDKSVVPPEGMLLHANEFVTMKCGSKSAIGQFRDGRLVMPRELPGGYRLEHQAAQQGTADCASASDGSRDSGCHAGRAGGFGENASGACRSAPACPARQSV